MSFESISHLAKKAQYKLTDKKLAYSITGGEHNVSGRIVTFRLRHDLTIELGWKAGDCIDILWDKDQQVGRLVHSDHRGYKLVIVGKRNGISSLRVGFTWIEEARFPLVKSQVPCEYELIENGLQFKILIEPEDLLEVPEYKSITQALDYGAGFTPKSRSNNI